VIDSSLVIDLNELADGVQEAVVTELDTLVGTVQQVERLSHQIELHSIVNIQTTSQAHVRGGVIRAQECVASGSGKSIIGTVVVLIGIAENACVNRAAAADGHDSGHLPILEDPTKESVIATEGARICNPRESKTMALIGDAAAAFGAGGIGILYSHWASGDERILSIVDGVTEGVGQPEIQTAGHATAQRNCEAVVHAGGGAFEYVNCADLWNRPHQRIDARRKGASQRSSELPGRESVDVVVSAEKVSSGIVVYGIGDLGGGGRLTSRARIRFSP